MTLKCVIIDDEPLAAQLLRSITVPLKWTDRSLN